MVLVRTSLGRGLPPLTMASLWGTWRDGPVSVDSESGYGLDGELAVEFPFELCRLFISPGVDDSRAMV